MTDKTRYHKMTDKLENAERVNEELKTKIDNLESQISELKHTYDLLFEQYKRGKRDVRPF